MLFCLARRWKRLADGRGPETLKRTSGSCQSSICLICRIFLNRADMDIEFSPLVEWLGTFALESKVIIRSNFGRNFGEHNSLWNTCWLTLTPEAKAWETWILQILLTDQDYSVKCLILGVHNFWTIRWTCTFRGSRSDRTFLLHPIMVCR